MPRSRPWLASLLPLVCGLALYQAVAAWAANFSVTPIRLVFSPTTHSALLALRNQSAEGMRFQLSVLAWDQSPTGEMQLTPTDDIVVFPTLFMLAPGDTRNIRVGPATPFASTEKTYRIFVEELPPLTMPEGSPVGVQILTRMGVPVFLQPAKVVQQGRIEGMAVHHGKLAFQTTNTGNVHFMEHSVQVMGFGPSGDSLFEHQEAGWYVLARGWRTRELELPKEVCAKIRALAVEVQTERATVHERVDVPPGSCGP